jgi:hypothetical protein
VKKKKCAAYACEAAHFAVTGVNQEAVIGKTMRGLLEEHGRITEILTCFEMK